MNIPYVMRKCTICGRWLVASTYNFHKQKAGKYGLKSKCKECQKRYHKQYHETNKDKIAEQRKQWRQENKEKVLERNKQYYQNNRGKEAERHNLWYKANKEMVREQHKQYYEANKDKIAERRKKYYESPQGQVAEFNKSQRRRIKEEQQGTGITKDQWLEMMSFFDWQCAYSGETLTKGNRSIDHIVPLNSNGDNMVWNCVPMVKSLNSRKHTKDMLEWYREQDFYSEARLAKIYEWKEHARKKWKK